MMGQCAYNENGYCNADDHLCAGDPWCGGSVAWALGLWGGPEVWQAFETEQNSKKDLFT